MLSLEICGDVDRVVGVVGVRVAFDIVVHGGVFVDVGVGVDVRVVDFGVDVYVVVGVDVYVDVVFVLMSLLWLFVLMFLFF